MSYMPTPPDYRGVSLIQSQSPALPYGWPKFPDQRIGSVARKKLRFKLHMFQNSKKSSGFLCLYYGFWLLFLAWCTLFIANKKKKVSSLLLLWRGGGDRGDEGGTRVSRFPYHVLPPPVLLCPFRLIKRIRKPGLTFKLCQNLTFLFIFRFIFLFSGSQQTIETIAFFISAPAPNPHIYPSSRPLLSRFLLSLAFCPPPSPLLPGSCSPVPYEYISESLIGWAFNQLKTLTDRSTFFPQNCL